MSGVGKQSLIDRRRDCENRQQQQIHDLARHLLYHNPVLVLLSIVVPALHFHASAWRAQLVVEEEHHIVCIRPSQMLCWSEDSD